MTYSVLPRTGSSTTVTLSLCLILLSGCASRADRPVDGPLAALPDVWMTSAETSQIDNAWWLRFGDDRLTTLIEDAQLENTGIGQSEARNRQALAQAHIAGADRLPQLSGVFNANRQKQSLAGFPIPGGGATSAETETYGANLNVSWEIDLWGKLAAQSNAARADYLASEANLRAVRQSIAAQTAKAYFAVTEAGEQVEFATRSVEALTETARQVGKRVATYEPPRMVWYSLTMRSVDLLLNSSTNTQIAEIYNTAKRDGLNFRLAFIPDDYPHEASELFDQEFMRELFSYAQRTAAVGYAWRDTPY